MWPKASQMQSQLRDSAVLEQWSATIVTPCAHMGLAGADRVHPTVVDGITKGVWLAHATARDGLIKACLRQGAQWHGRCEDFNYTSRQNGMASWGGPGRSPQYVGIAVPTAGGAQLTTHITRLDTQLPIMQFPCAGQSRPLPFGNTAFGTPHHTTDHEGEAKGHSMCLRTRAVRMEMAQLTHVRGHAARGVGHVGLQSTPRGTRFTRRDTRGFSRAGTSQCL